MWLWLCTNMATCQPRDHFLCIDQLSKSKGSKLLNNHGMSRMILVAVPTSSPDIWGPEVVNVHDGDDDGLVKRRPIRWSLYWYLDFCDDHLSQNPDNRETGYSHVPVMDKAKHILTQEKNKSKPVANVEDPAGQVSCVSLLHGQVRWHVRVKLRSRT